MFELIKKIKDLSLRRMGSYYGVIFLLILVAPQVFPKIAIASMSTGTILSGSGRGYSWSSYAGYMNWLTRGDVQVSDSGLSGYVWDPNYGWLNLSPGHGGVLLDSSTGALSGYAWSWGAGWVNFSGASINENTGFFQGVTATSSNYGNINFSCANCAVVTDWRPLSMRSSTSSSVGSMGANNASGGGAQTPTQLPVALVATYVTPTSEDPSLDQRKSWGMNRLPNQNNTDGVSEAMQNIPSDRHSIATDGTAIYTPLFDIYFFAERKTIAKSSDLVTRATFDSFGSGPATAAMTFTIVDMSGKELYRRSATTTVETQGLYVMRYRDLNLPDGKYRALLRVKYRKEGEDDFSIPFTVDERLANEEVSLRIALQISLIVLPVMYAIYFGVMKRRVTTKDIEDDIYLAKQR